MIFDGNILPENVDSLKNSESRHFRPKNKYKVWKLEEVNFKTIFYGCLLHRITDRVIWLSHFRFRHIFLIDEMRIICFPFLKNCCDNHKRQNLSKGAIKMILTPNAGGDSRISEWVSFQIFNWLCNAVLLKVVLIVYFFLLFHVLQMKLLANLLFIFWS